MKKIRKPGGAYTIAGRSVHAPASELISAVKDDLTFVDGDTCGVLVARTKEARDFIARAWEHAQAQAQPKVLPQ